MHIFDKLRPRNAADTPLLLNSDHIVPHLLIRFIPTLGPDVILASVMLRTSEGDRAYRQVSLTLRTDILYPFIAAYMDDPERTLQQSFNWQPPAGASPRQGASITSTLDLL